MKCPKCEYQFRGKICPECGTDPHNYQPPKTLNQRMEAEKKPVAQQPTYQSTVGSQPILQQPVQPRPQPTAQQPRSSQQPPQALRQPVVVNSGLNQPKPANAKTKGKALSTIVFVFFFMASIVLSVMDNVQSKPVPEPNIPPLKPPAVDVSGLLGDYDIVAGSLLTQQLNHSDADIHFAGTYEVGVDIPAGEYFMIASDWAETRLYSDAALSEESLIYYYDFYGTRYITLEEGQYFSYVYGAMTLVQNIKPQQEAAREEYLYEYMYKVGFDLPAGTYQLKALPKTVEESGDCYYEINSDSSGLNDAIVDNDFFADTITVTVEEGQYLLLDGCEIVRGEQY